MLVSGKGILNGSSERW